MDDSPPQTEPAPQPSPEALAAAQKQSTLDPQMLLTLLGLGGDSALPARRPDPELVMETLDAEMSRIEQALVRSGWTSWVGTAALAGIVWLFVSLFDAGATFPWSRFAVLVTFLSFIQEFIYCLDNALRPRRAFGLQAGDQMRMVITAETLPFARPQFLFEGLRAALLMVASWYLITEFVGWIWLLPFVWYSGILVTMCVFFAMSVRKKLVPKRIKFFPGELVRHALLAGLACFGLHALAGTWEATDFLALKGALLAIAALHVLRSLMAPRFELPALERLREIRRKLGFGQMPPHDAVTQAEIALFGYSALLVMARPIQEFANLLKQLHEQQRRIAEDLEVLTRQLSALAAQENVTGDEIALRDALAGNVLAKIHEALETSAKAAHAHAQLLQRIAHYRQRTVNDRSIPLVVEVARRQELARTALTGRLVAAVPALVDQVNGLNLVASKQQLTLAPGVRDAALALAQELKQLTAASSTPS